MYFILIWHVFIIIFYTFNPHTRIRAVLRIIVTMLYSIHYLSLCLSLLTNFIRLFALFLLMSIFLFWTVRQDFFYFSLYSFGNFIIAFCWWIVLLGILGCVSIFFSFRQFYFFFVTGLHSIPQGVLEVIVSLRLDWTHNNPPVSSSQVLEL